MRAQRACRAPRLSDRASWLGVWRGLDVGPVPEGQERAEPPVGEVGWGGATAGAGGWGSARSAGSGDSASASRGGPGLKGPPSLGTEGVGARGGGSGPGGPPS